MRNSLLRLPHLRKAVVLWDVDTQVDFVLPHGKLRVEGAEDAVPAMAALVRWARETGTPHIASADDHELTDPELSSAPDFESTFPPHCLRGTPGVAKIVETAQVDPLPLSLTPYPPGLIPELVGARRELLVLKKTYDVFSNPNTDAVLDLLDPSEVVVFGVATDICVDAAVRALVARGRNVTVVEDATRGLSADRVAACVSAWREAGVRLATVDEVLGASVR